MPKNSGAMYSDDKNECGDPAVYAAAETFKKSLDDEWESTEWPGETYDMDV